MKRIATIVLILFLPCFAFARLGGCGAAFLSIGGGARALALGGAYSAFAEGVDAIYWNPAGLAKINTISGNFVHVKLYAGMSQENLGIVIPIKGGAIGISAIAFLSGRIEITTVEEQHGTGEYYSANDFAVGISYSRMMTDKFALGVTIKGIQQNIHKVFANGWAIDIGGVYNTKLRNLRFGFVIQNFGQDMAYSGEGLEDFVEMYEMQGYEYPVALQSAPYPLPRTFQTGLAFDAISMPSHRLTFISDLVHPSDQEATFAVGLEYSLEEKYFARLGYTEKNNRGLSAGFGIIMPLQMFGKFTLDYSFEDHRTKDGLPSLPGIHRISLGFSM